MFFQWYLNILLYLLRKHPSVAHANVITVDEFEQIKLEHEVSCAH